MSYTTLRITDAGVVLHSGHRERLAPAGHAALTAFDRFAASAAPGIYSLRAEGDRLAITALAASRLIDGMPTRARVSPLTHLRGAQPKPASPCSYDTVRQEGVATLLTSSDGSEIYEACVAAVIGWDGARLVCVPSDRPRVASVTEAALRLGLPFVEAPLLVADTLPLALINAVKGVCEVELPNRAALPQDVLATMRSLLAATTRRA